MAKVTPGAATPVANADVALATSPTLVSRLVAELFGTFLLVGGVIGTALFTSSNTGILGVALAVGLAVIAGAYSVGHISGGHFNPAVSLGAAAAGRFAWRDVVPYIVAQLVGGALATTVLFVIAANGPAGLLDDVTRSGFASNGYGTHSPAGFGLVAVIVTEVVLTGVFLYVILGVTDRRAPSGFAPLAIGLTLTLLHLVAIPVSNASFNPARSIATAIYGGPDALGQVWVFILAPIVGALLAGFTYRVLFDRKSA
ncbi:aquaporin Z [soil metagenome]